MDNNLPNGDSYSYLQWRLSIARNLSYRGGELTSGGKAIANLEVYLALFCIIVAGLVIVLIPFFYSFIMDCLGFNPRGNLPEPLRTIIKITVVPFFFTMVFGLHYMLFPTMGRIAYLFYWIDEDELEIILKRRIPRSIFKDPNSAPCTWL